MKRMMIKDVLLLSMLSGLAWSASAVAQSPQTGEAGQTGQQQSATISAREHAANAQAMFKRMDADNDGTLTRAELDVGRRMMMGATKQQGMRHGMGQPGMGPGMMGPGMGPDMMGPGMMGQGMGPGMMMDRDRDGTISAQEHADMARAMFQRMDTNDDGRVSVEEMKYANASMMGAEGRGMGMGMMGAGMGLGMRSAELIELMDVDDDGRISASEYVAGTRALFEEADTDSDGNLSMAERAAHHELMMQRVNDAGEEAGG